MSKEQLEARLKELFEQIQKGTEQIAMLKGAAAEVRRLLTLAEESNDGNSD